MARVMRTSRSLALDTNLSTSSNRIVDLDESMQNNSLPLIITSSDVTYIDKFLGDQDIGRLVDAIQTSSIDVKRIVLRGNCIGPNGADILSALLINQVINVYLLSLEWNQILSEGAIRIADALESNLSLAHLDLRNNNITDDGALSLSKALIGNKTLKVLDLRWNQITDKGMLSFREALLTRQPPLQLFYHGNLISESARVSLDIWSSGNDKSNDVDHVVDESVTVQISTDITLKAQNEILTKELQELRAKYAVNQSHVHDLTRQLESSAIRLTELEQSKIRNEFTIKGLDETIKQLKESMIIQQDDKRNLTNAWELERNTLLSDMKNVLVSKDSEILHLKGERDSAQDRLMKTEVNIQRLTNQLREMEETMNQQRVITQEELKQALNKANDLAIIETRLRADNSSMRHNLDRSLERIASLEHQLMVLESNHESKLQEELNDRKNEIEKLRQGYTDQIAMLTDKIASQHQSLTDLHAELSTLDLTTAKRLAEMQQSHENELNAARSLEKKRYQTQETGLMQRLERMTISFQESEARCQELYREIQDMKSEHEKFNAILDARTRTLESQLRSKHEEYLAIKQALLKTEGELQSKTILCHDLEERSIQINKDFHVIEKERQDLIILKESQAAKILSLQRLHQELTDNRQKEFHLISTHVQESIKRELELLRGNLHIAAETSDRPEQEDKEAKPKDRHDSTHSHRHKEHHSKHNDQRQLDDSLDASLIDQSMISERSMDSNIEAKKSKHSKHGHKSSKPSSTTT